MLNKVLLQGRFTRDPELRHTNTGTAVASFSLAVDRDYKGDNGERGTDFIDFVAWRSTGEFVARNFAKGRAAVVEGRLQARSWTDDAGNKRKTTEVVVDNIYFADSKRKEETAPAQANPYAPPPDTYGNPHPYGQYTHGHDEFGDYQEELPI